MRVAQIPQRIVQKLLHIQNNYKLHGMRFSVVDILLDPRLRLNKYIAHFCIPKDYSFCVLGGHGSGLHSLLYFISLLESKASQKPKSNLLPLSMHTLNNEVILGGGGFSLQVLKELLINTYSTYGITIDGINVDNVRWLERFLDSRQIPVICLVRDPISILLSCMNYNTKATQSFAYIESYFKCYAHRYNPSIPYAGTLDFYSKVHFMQPYTKDLLYIDCAKLIGKQTNATMQTIADFLDCKKPHIDFDIKVNDWVSRFSPIVFRFYQYTIYISTFYGSFESSVPFPLYHAKDKRLYICPHYTSPLFPQKTFAISTLSKSFPKHLQGELFIQVQKQLESLYARYTGMQSKSITIEFLLEFLSKSQHYKTELRNVLAYQLKHLKAHRPDIVEGFTHYQRFLNL